MEEAAAKKPIPHLSNQNTGLDTCGAINVISQTILYYSSKEKAVQGTLPHNFLLFKQQILASPLWKKYPKHTSKINSALSGKNIQQKQRISVYNLWCSEQWLRK
jgi:hypothetical protein